MMIARIGCFVAGCLAMFGALAAEPSATAAVEVGRRAYAALQEAVGKAMESCATSRTAVTLPHYDRARNAETTAEAIVTLEWSGGCTEGRRDGEGVLSWAEDRSFGSGTRLVMRYRAEGRFVRGQRLGLWCMSSVSQTFAQGNPQPERPGLTAACAVYGGNAKALTPYFQKQPDGSWRELVAGRVSDTTVAAGTLEAQSQKVLAEARGGAAAPAAVAVSVESRTDEGWRRAQRRIPRPVLQAGDACGEVGFRASPVDPVSQGNSVPALTLP